MSVSLQPVGDRLILREIDADEKVGNIHLPPTAAREFDSTQGLVIAAGEGRTTLEGALVPLAVKVGDRVVFDGKDALLVRVAGQKFVALREQHVIAIVGNAGDA
jgi:chaperonin GroES